MDPTLMTMLARVTEIELEELARRRLLEREARTRRPMRRSRRLGWLLAPMRRHAPRPA